MAHVTTLHDDDLDIIVKIEKINMKRILAHDWSSTYIIFLRH